MITDEQLIQRLRAGMHSTADDVTAPYELLDGVSPAARRGVRLPRLGGLVAVLATASTIAVVVGALVLLGHRRTEAARPVAPAHPAVTAGSTLAELRSKLAILRRPQSVVDKLSAPEVAAEQQRRCSACLNVAKLLPNQTRLLTTIGIARHSPERIYLVLGTVPTTWGDGRISGWNQSARAIGGLHLSLVGFPLHRSPGALPIDEVLNPASLPIPAQTLSPRAVLITSLATVGLVPDGVTRVKWELDNPGQRTPIAVYPRVRGNVAVALSTPAPHSTGLTDEQLLAGATWYGPDGRVVASFNVPTQEIDRAHSLRGAGSAQ